jgi:toxin ParE1/3/4
MSSSHPEIQLTDQAANDVLMILSHTQKVWGDVQRHRYLQLITEAFQRIRDFPLIGTIDNPARPSIRRRGIEHHLCFYEILESGDILVLRVLHKRMELSNWETVEWATEE